MITLDIWLCRAAFYCTVFVTAVDPSWKPPHISVGELSVIGTIMFCTLMVLTHLRNRTRELDP